MRVLIIDDDPGTCETLGTILSLAGHHASAAFTGRHGLALAQVCVFDLILADLRLPDISGIDVLRDLKQAGVQVPLVIMTGLGSIPSAVEALKLGAADYVEKPLFDDDLLRIVHGCAHTSSGNPRPPSSVPQESAEIAARSIDKWVVLALRIIERRCCDIHLSVGGTAHELGISTEHLCRLFKDQTGCTFMQHVVERRVGLAKQLLGETPLSMKEIAQRVGFENTSQFDRRFRAVCGMTPTFFRRAMWQKESPDKAC